MNSGPTEVNVGMHSPRKATAPVSEGERRPLRLTVHIPDPAGLPGAKIDRRIPATHNTENLVRQLVIGRHVNFVLRIICHGPSKPQRNPSDSGIWDEPAQKNLPSRSLEEMYSIEQQPKKGTHFGAVTQS